MATGAPRIDYAAKYGIDVSVLGGRDHTAEIAKPVAEGTREIRYPFKLSDLPRDRTVELSVLDLEMVMESTAPASPSENDIDFGAALIPLSGATSGGMPGSQSALLPVESGGVRAMVRRLLFRLGLARFDDGSTDSDYADLTC